MIRSSSAWMGWVRSRRLKTIASPPDGRSTRAISRSASGPLNQWKAWATVTASALWSASGIDSAVPATARTSGRAALRLARISAEGSTAMSRVPRVCRRRVSLPVPAARSTTTEDGCNRKMWPIQVTTGGGYSGRPRS